MECLQTKQKYLAKNATLPLLNKMMAVKIMRMSRPLCFLYSALDRGIGKGILILDHLHVLELSMTPIFTEQVHVHIFI